MNLKITILTTFLLITTFSFSQIGIIDSTFDVGTGFGPTINNGGANAIVQQPDGKLIIAGGYSTYNDEEVRMITRLNLDGTRDLSFSSPFLEGSSINIHALALQPDGKILVGGRFSRVGDKWVSHIARLNSDGSYDESFDPKSGFDNAVLRLGLAPDGKIYVGGMFLIYDVAHNGLRKRVNSFVRLHSDGSLDTTFDIGRDFLETPGLGNAGVTAYALQPNGKMIAGGSYSCPTRGNSNFLARFFPDGSIDSTFDASEHRANNTIQSDGTTNDLKLLPNGQIIFSGQFINAKRGLERLNSDGSLDTTFNISPEIDNHLSRKVLFQSDGKMLITRAYFNGSIIERYHPNGQLDTSFTAHPTNRDIQDFVIQNDGNITLVGTFYYNPIGIVRLIGDTPNTISTDNIQIAESIKLYPNPAQNVIYFQHLPANAQLTITDLNGKIIHQNNATNQDATLDISHLQNGLYIIAIQNNGQFVYKKLMVNR